MFIAGSLRQDVFKALLVKGRSSGGLQTVSEGCFDMETIEIYVIEIRR